MQIDMSRFRAAFYVEAGEHLEQMEAALLQLESNPSDIDLLNTIFRAAHSIKGASTTFGIEEVGRFTHVLESVLERLRDGGIRTCSDLIEVLLSSIDVIKGLIAHTRDGADPPNNVDDILSRLHQYNDSTAKSPQMADPSISLGRQLATSKYVVIFKPCRACFRFGQDPLMFLRDLHELGEVTSLTLDESELPRLEDINPEDCYLTWKIELVTSKSVQDIHNVFIFLDSESSYTIEALQFEQLTSQQQTNLENSAKDATNNSEPSETAQSERRTGNDRRQPTSTRSNELETVRVDRQRLDDLINQIGELVIGTSMVEQELQLIVGAQNIESLSSLGKIVRDLQEMSLSLRMVPIAATFQKMNRVIRDVAKKLDKQINFITEGDDTELDKSVVDQISDPLVHMVRNSADHGIETPEERLAAGKVPDGEVKLRAYQQGGNIYIELSDDGRGLNRSKILAKAIDKGIVPPDANLSEGEIFALIFQPGFSTADQVTDVSGRGVGMDVVRRNVEALQGNITVRSHLGKGSVFTIRLPLTLAILDGLLVRLSDEVFVIPLLSVVESISIRRSEIKHIVNAGDVITIRGEVVPILKLHRLFHRPEPAESESALLVIVEDQGKRIALAVDDLIGQQQVVIKNLETNFRKVQGIAGATILGDGRVALILDIYGVSTIKEDGHRAAMPEHQAS